MFTIFNQSLRRWKWQIIGWGSSLLVIAMYLMWLYKPMMKQQAQVKALFDAYGKEMLSFFGGTVDIFSAGGYLNFGFFSYIPVVLGILALLLGAGLVVADEEKGTLDLILAHPISRTALFWGRWLALVAALMAVLVLTWAGFAVGLPWTGLNATVWQLLLPHIALFSILLLFSSLALWLSLVLPSRTLAASVTAALLVASYLVTSLASVNAKLEPLNQFSPLKSYQGGSAINGLHIGPLLSSCGIALGFALLGWLLFLRRDIRVSGEGTWGLPRILLVLCGALWLWSGCASGPATAERNPSTGRQPSTPPANVESQEDPTIYLPLVTHQQPAPTLAGCSVFPADNIWNTPVDTLPVDPNSDVYVATIGANASVHADFGSGLWEGGPIGIPYVTVPGTQPRVPVTFDYADESDPGPYPIPPDAPIEGGAASNGDRHVLVVDRDNCVLYELYYAFPVNGGSAWTAGSGAIFDLSSHALRPASWTSADAAGLPILPGLVRYAEVAAGEIRHALRFTAPQTRRAYVWPARHYASDLTGAQYPPMGQRFRLKADFDIRGFSPEVQVILRALKTYGMMLADNGAAWYISGAPDERWDNDVLHELHQITGAAFEAVDVSALMVDANSGQVKK